MTIATRLLPGRRSIIRANDDYSTSSHFPVGRQEASRGEGIEISCRLVVRFTLQLVASSPFSAFAMRLRVSGTP